MGKVSLLVNHMQPKAPEAAVSGGVLGWIVDAEAGQKVTGLKKTNIIAAT